MDGVPGCDVGRCRGRRRSNTGIALRDDLGVPLDSNGW